MSRQNEDQLTTPTGWLELQIRTLQDVNVHISCMLQAYVVKYRLVFYCDICIVSLKYFLFTAL